MRVVSTLGRTSVSDSDSGSDSVVDVSVSVSDAPTQINFLIVFKTTAINKYDYIGMSPDMAFSLYVYPTLVDLAISNSKMKDWFCIRKR